MVERLPVNAVDPEFIEGLHRQLFAVMRDEKLG